VQTIDFAAIREGLPIIDYVRRLGVRLRRSGSLFIGKCPIHREQHGEAFTVDPETQRWRCWGKCSGWGDVLDLEQALGGGTLAEAAERLGGRQIAETLSIAKPQRAKPASAITTENPVGLPYRMTSEEIYFSFQAATRLVRSVRLINRVAERRRWRPETIRNLALEPSLGIDSQGRMCFLYETGCKRRWQDDEGNRQIRWAFGKPWLWRFGYITLARTVFVCEGETDAITMPTQGLSRT
jgi:hypothetical protein